VLQQFQKPKLRLPDVERKSRRSLATAAKCHKKCVTMAPESMPPYWAKRNHVAKKAGA